MALIMLRGGFNIWPDLLQFLSDLLKKQQELLDKEGFNMAIVENAMHTITIIVEDCSKLFEDKKYEALITEIFPQICALINQRYSEEVVANAINTINMLLMTDVDIVLQNVTEYFGVLLNIGNQINAAGGQGYLKPRWRIIQGVTTIMELRLELIVQHFEQVCQLMVGALLLKDQQVALAATEFWSGIISKKDDIDTDEYEKRIQVI